MRYVLLFVLGVIATVCILTQTDFGAVYIDSYLEKNPRFGDKVIGHYSWKNNRTTANANISKISSESYILKLKFVTPSCLAEFEGEGVLNRTERTILFLHPSDATCKIEASWEENFTVLKTTENQCSNWHGFECSFEAKLPKAKF